MRAKEFIAEMTTAGAVATVMKPLGGTIRRNKKQKGLFDDVTEGSAINDEYLEIRFNNENAYDTAYRKFGNIWEEPNAEQIFIHEKYLDRVEDELFSRGFNEPEDYEISAADPDSVDYSLYPDPDFADEEDLDEAKVDTSMIDPAKQERMAAAILRQFEQEGWTVRNRREAGLQVDEFIDASLGWPTVPKQMSPFQKAAREIMINAVMANRG